LIQIKKIFGFARLKISGINHLRFAGLAKILEVKDLFAKYRLKMALGHSGHSGSLIAFESVVCLDVKDQGRSASGAARS
jgi:hypothetical protein